MRRKSICGRDPNAGPGTCWFYWDSCPAKVKNCFLRHMREWAKEHGIGDHEEKTLPPDQLDALIAQAISEWPGREKTLV